MTKDEIKIGVSYNLFDGEELLPFSIATIRKNVDYINVVYQTTSNFGNPASKDLEEKLKNLKKEGLIDELYLYEPNLTIEPRKNEIIKRDIGFELSKKNNCDYFLSMDVDEFYDENQFKNALYYIVANDITTSATSCIEYLKSPEYQVVGIHTFLPNSEDMFNFYVPFFVKISKTKKQKHGTDYFPCVVDPTRKLYHEGKFKLFSVHQLAMHHMSTIRKDLAKKYNNSSSLGSSKNTENFVRIIEKEINDFDFEASKKIPENLAISGFKVVRKVENKFNIKLN